MAKTPVKLEIDGYKEREVLMVTYEFDQATDIEGQMSGIPRGGKITIKVKAMNDGTPDLLAWMVERNLPKNGTITFMETKTGKVMKTIKFTNGYCIDFDEKWEDKLGHFEQIVITCQKIEFGSVVFENDWA
ncbi:MAG: type VI secretion system tube protein TssD [Parabacteroides sp.]|nr:type VI secretion system tube protein TssD [Parabacteroides sp.]